jgi:hypothetical protein
VAIVRSPESTSGHDTDDAADNPWGQDHSHPFDELTRVPAVLAGPLSKVSGQ